LLPLGRMLKGARGQPKRAHTQAAAFVAMPVRIEARPRVRAAAAGRAGEGSGAPPPPAATSSTRAPLLDAMRERGGRRTEVPLHVPGHKRGEGAHPALVQLLGADVLRHDLTELEGLDFLAYPNGPIMEAQELAAQTFGAEATWFLVNGTTVGIQAAVMATCGPGSHLILSRNCHQSAHAALVLSGASPIYAASPVSATCGVAATMTPRALSAALERAAALGQRVGAVLVVSPTYYGVCADVEALARVCHGRGVPLLVDEAHGAHLSLHPSLPVGAMQQGADIAIQSTHKVLGSMTQSSMLHAQGDRVCRAQLSAALRTLQSSSPSYILMASLDAARLQVAEAGGLSGAVAAAEFLRKGLAELPGIRLLEDDAEHLAGMAGTDPLRFTVDVQQLGMSGYHAAGVLEEQHGVVAELSTPQVVVFALGVGSSVSHASSLLAALGALAEGAAHSNTAAAGGGAAVEGIAAQMAALGEPDVVLSPRDAFFRRKRRVSMEEGAGEVCGELLCPYPPGIPLLFPGERISGAALALLAEVQRQGGRVVGASDPQLRSVLVCD